MGDQYDANNLAELNANANSRLVMARGYSPTQRSAQSRIKCGIKPEVSAKLAPIVATALTLIEVKVY